jgi:hypothetical protein
MEIFAFIPFFDYRTLRGASRMDGMLVPSGQRGIEGLNVLGTFVTID